MERDIQQSYKYTLKWSSVLLLLTLGGVLSVSTTTDALKPNASYFEWLLAGIMYMTTLIGLYGVIENLIGKTRIAVTDKGILMPNRPWRKGEAFVPYSSIQHMSVSTAKKSQFLTIKTDDIDYLIPSDRFPNLTDFEQFMNIVTSRIETL